MDSKAREIFAEINGIYEGKTRLSPEKTRHLDENLIFYQRYCESLKLEQNEDNAVYYALFSHFLSQAEIYSDLVGNKETQCFSNYREMSINQINGSARYSGKVKESIERDLQEVLYELLSNTRGKLERYGFIKELYQREKQSLVYLGLTDIMPQDSTQIEEATFSQDSFRFRPIPEEIAINLFWINKYWKALGKSKLSLWLLDTHKRFGNDKNEITDKEKILAIKREQVLDYVQQLITDKGEDMSFEDFILCLYGQRASLPDSERLRRANSKMQKVSPELRKEFAEIERLYNNCFETEEIAGGQLINDCLYNLYMLKEKINVKTIKEILTRQLLELLVIDKANPFPKYSTWGLTVDKKMSGTNRNILIMEIPGALKPLQVHVPEKLISDRDSRIPDYRGIYDNPDDEMSRICTTNFLIYLNLEQTRILKQKMKKRRENYKKSHDKSEKPIVQMLEYMTAISTKDMAKVYQIMKTIKTEEQEQR